MLAMTAMGASVLAAGRGAGGGARHRVGEGDGCLVNARQDMRARRCIVVVAPAAHAGGVPAVCAGAPEYQEVIDDDEHAAEPHRG
ncbi:hypothetical protein GCM10025877_17340 [Agromyces mangrovi Wang et al. 2018]|nr:hypothetical protein GCM10025877_17340 [Agromyces mangrovi]